MKTILILIGLLMAALIMIPAMILLRYAEKIGREKKEKAKGVKMIALFFGAPFAWMSAYMLIGMSSLDNYIVDIIIYLLLAIIYCLATYIVYTQHSSDIQTSDSGNEKPTIDERNFDDNDSKTD